MKMNITDALSSAEGLKPEDAGLVRDLVAEWSDNYAENALRDAYYAGKVRVKDLGVSVSPRMAKKVDPRVDWAAKCVDWWADRTQFEGATCADDEAGETLQRVFRENDMKNLVHKTAQSALIHCCAFMTVTSGNEGAGEPHTVVSGYPATAASAIWDDARKRIRAGMVVVESEKLRHSDQRYPKTVYVFTDRDLITISRDDIRLGFAAEYTPHSMGRVPMEPIAYHASLLQPFGRSRITETVMRLVDDAQREMLNMTVAASFSAAPQKYLMGADRGTAEKIAGSPFSAFIGSLFVGTTNRNGQVPQYGQLGQLSMQPHTEYMRNLAAQFSNATGVPLSSLGVVSDNPSSAEAIYAAKEDAVVDIQGFVDGCKRSIGSIAVMALANEAGSSYFDALAAFGSVNVNFGNPAMPSVVSQSDAIVKQISAIPWLADSDVTLRELGYDDEQIVQLENDRRRSQGLRTLQTIAGMSDEDAG